MDGRREPQGHGGPEGERAMDGRREPIGQVRYMDTVNAPGSFAISDGATLAAIFVDPADHPGVIRAVADLGRDIERVTGRVPRRAGSDGELGTNAIVVGTMGKSPLVDRLIRSGKIAAQGVRGQWESYLIQVVDEPLGGVRRALVIAGSDKRGTIYGVYDLSEQMGVSPWYWWADVPVARKTSLFVKAGSYVQGPPSVKYRGIFLNDEAPALTNWVAAKYGMVRTAHDPPMPPGVANYGRDFYTRLFELILRLRGNYLWPAMWNNAFNEDDPENARLADLYGVVMGTSHQEPMLRAQKEWDRRYQATIGSWNYARHPRVLQGFWREGIRRNRDFESIITLGLRGANDTEMAPGGPEANRALLEEIVRVQRRIIAQETGRPADKVPQLWCLYKEVQDFYSAGMRVPDDVTLLWAEDNWGNVRRLPTAAERARPGGAGVYYHFDYHGGPRSYQWLNTSPIAKIWDQMSLAKQYGADRIWIVNVGHFKGYELPLEYFLSLAWDTEKWTADRTGAFTRLWAERVFGPQYAEVAADVVSQYSRYNGRRKPELLSPDSYSLTDYREWETVVADYKALAARAEGAYATMPAEMRNAFYQLVLFPAKASALVNEIYYAAARNALYWRQGRASTNDMAALTRALFRQDLDLMAHYNNTFADGKWAHFMDQTHLGYTSWRDPPVNGLDAIDLRERAPVPVASLGVAVEGSADAWPGAGGTPTLPTFDSLGRQTRYIEVFNRGEGVLDATASADAPWITLSATAARLERDLRVEVSVDWSRAPHGKASGAVTVRGARCEVVVGVAAFNPEEVTRESLRGFVESEGYVSVEAESFSRNTPSGARRWTPIEQYGRTLSGMRAEAPVDAQPATPGRDSPVLEYDMYLFTTGSVNVWGVFSPTLNFHPGRPLRCAVSFDDESPRIITLVPAGYDAGNGNRDWERTVADSARYAYTSHTIATPGYHTLKVWMVDPGVVVEKLVVNLGGLKPSYLGPPQSYRGGEG